MGLGMLGLGWIAIIPFWALLVLGIIALVKWMGAQEPTARGREGRALEVLKRRYAQGEMTREEFKLMKEDIAEGVSFR